MKTEMKKIINRIFLRIYRLLSDFTSTKFFNWMIGNYIYSSSGARWLGFENGVYRYFHAKVYDYIDYVHGASQLAEKHAQESGYWNLFSALWRLDQLVDIYGAKGLKIAAEKKDKELFKKIKKEQEEYKWEIAPYVLDHYQVRKY